MHGIPTAQSLFMDDGRAHGMTDMAILLLLTPFCSGIYSGPFTLPVSAGALFGLVCSRQPVNSPMRILLLAVVAFMCMSVATGAANGHIMPYLGQYFRPTSLGPDDLLESRSLFVEPWLLFVFIVVFLFGAITFTFAMSRSISTLEAPTERVALVGFAVMVGQEIGMIPPSFHFLTWAGPLDRYLLPLLPLSIWLAVWATRRVRLVLPLAWAVGVVFAVYSVVGTRDFLVFQEATWSVARHANELGIPNTKLDGGAAWDGYHLYELFGGAESQPKTPNAP